VIRIKRWQVDHQSLTKKKSRLLGPSGGSRVRKRKGKLKTFEANVAAARHGGGKGEKVEKGHSAREVWRTPGRGDLPSNKEKQAPLKKNQDTD